MQRGFVRSIKIAFKQEPWAVTLLGLLWSAGPIAAIALMIGYLAGYRTLPNLSLIIYFSVYILISGIATIAFRLLVNSSDSIQKSKQEFRENVVFEKILALMNTNKALYLASLPNKKRAFIEAIIVFNNSDATETELEAAMSLISDDKELRKTLHDIEVFRRYGYANRVEEKMYQVKPKLDMLLTTAEEFISQQQRALILKRFMGIQPSKKIGKVRTQGFIQRFLDLRNNNNYDFISSDDVTDALSLIYELLCKREIKRYRSRIGMKSDLILLSCDLERYNSSFKSLLNIRNNKITCLKKIILDSGFIEKLDTDLDNEFDDYRITSLLLNKVLSDFKRMKREADKKSLKLFKELFLQIEGLIMTIEAINVELGIISKKIESSMQNYQQARYQYQESSNYTSNVSKSGLDIYEDSDSILLSDTEVASVVDKVYKLLADLSIDRETLQVKVKGQNSKNKLNHRDIKSLSFKLINILNKEVPLEDLRTQSAIEASNAPDFGSLELGLTMKTILDWSINIIKEVENDVPNMIYRIAQWYMNFSREKLSTHLTNYLQANYDADPGIIEKLTINDPTALYKSKNFDKVKKQTNNPLLEDDLEDLLEEANQVLIT